VLGLVIGDMAGSPHEFGRTPPDGGPLLSGRSRFTDDTVLACAVAEALLGAGAGEPPYAARLRDRKSVV